MPRKLVQIATAPSPHGATRTPWVFGLADDGTLWQCAMGNWTRLPDLPGSTPVAQEAAGDAA